MQVARRWAAALLVLPTLAQAQSATINATATVVTALTVTGNAPLAFGNVYQGVNKPVAYADAGSGRMSIAGFNTAQVALTFTLPSNLTSGAATLPIDTWDVARNTTNVTTGAASMAVTSGTPVNANLSAGNLYLFIGATVRPGALQAAGSYSGTITLAAAYTGL